MQGYYARKRFRKESSRKLTFCVVHILCNIETRQGLIKTVKSVFIDTSITVCVPFKEIKEVWN